MSIDSGFYRKERNAGNDTFQVRESERKSNNPYYSSNSAYTPNRRTVISAENYDESILKLEYYNNHFEELTKDATAEQLFELSREISKLQLLVKTYEAEQQVSQMRGRKF